MAPALPLVAQNQSQGVCVAASGSPALTSICILSLLSNPHSCAAVAAPLLAVNKHSLTAVIATQTHTDRTR